MRMSFKYTAAVCVLAMSGAASAAPIAPEGLFFTAWDQSNNRSIVVNLNETTTSFRATPSAARSLGGDGLTALSAWLAASLDTSLVRWQVSGASNDGTGSDAVPSPLYGGLSTATNIETVFPGWGLFGGLDTTVNNFTIFRNVVNPELASTNAYSTPNILTNFFVNQNGGVGFESLANIGQSMGFYSFFADQDGNEFFEGDFTNLGGAWTLTYAAGIGAALSYIGGTTGPAVPLPPALWLLGSSLLGLVGIARRKIAVAA